MKRTSRFQSGFTLIELLAVIVLVGVLATGLITLINPLEQLGKSRKTDLSEIQKALELYYQDHGRYPAADGSLDQIRNANGENVPWGTSFAPYITELPKDTGSGKRYAYEYLNNSSRGFPSREKFIDEMHSTDAFASSEYRVLFAGASFLYKGIVR